MAGVKREVVHAVRADQALLLAALRLRTQLWSDKLLQLGICLTYPNDQGKPGVKTLTFSTFILILVLIGWAELLSVLWWYNPRHSIPKISNVLQGYI